MRKWIDVFIMVLSITIPICFYIIKIWWEILDYKSYILALFIIILFFWYIYGLVKWYQRLWSLVNLINLWYFLELFIILQIFDYAFLKTSFLKENNQYIRDDIWMAFLLIWISLIATWIIHVYIINKYISHTNKREFEKLDSVK